MRVFFKPKDVVKILGLSYRQIQYWDKTGFISPSHKRRGKYRFYTFSDLLRLRVAQSLRESGRSIQKLHQIMKVVKELLYKTAVPLERLTFLIEGQRVLMFSGEVLMGGKEDRRKPSVVFKARTLQSRVQELFPDGE